MIDVVVADYSNPTHCEAIITLLNQYSSEPIGAGKPLSESTTKNLIEQMQQREYIFSLIAYQQNQAVGLAICIESFSTFNCAPVLNLHDITVMPESRGLGISQFLLKKAEEIAIEKGCCKLTLEVLDINQRAKNAYLKFGFTQDSMQDGKPTKELFYRKSI